MSCSQTLKNDTLTHPSLWADYSKLRLEDALADTLIGVDPHCQDQFVVKVSEVGRPYGKALVFFVSTVVCAIPPSRPSYVSRPPKLRDTAEGVQYPHT